MTSTVCETAVLFIGTPQAPSQEEVPKIHFCNENMKSSSGGTHTGTT